MFEKKTGIVSRYFLFSFPGDVGIQWKSNMSDSSGINWYKNKILNSVDYFLVLMLRRGVYERLAIIPSRWENNSQRLRQNVGTFFTLNELQLLFQGNPRFDPDSVFSITGFRRVRENYLSFSIIMNCSYETRGCFRGKTSQRMYHVFHFCCTENEKKLTVQFLFFFFI